MGEAQNRFGDTEELDFLRNLNYYENTSPQEDNTMVAQQTAVVGMYNSSKQVLFEPGIIDTLGNALLHFATNGSSFPVKEEQEVLAAALTDNANSSKNCSNVTVWETDLRHSQMVTGVFCFAYLFVFVVGFLGNLFTVGVVWKLPRMRSVTNYFIVSLAIADILVLVVCLPGTLMSNIFVRKYFCDVPFFFFFLVILVYHRSTDTPHSQDLVLGQGRTMTQRQIATLVYKKMCLIKDALSFVID